MNFEANIIAEIVFLPNWIIANILKMRWKTMHADDNKMVSKDV